MTGPPGAPAGARSAADDAGGAGAPLVLRFWGVRGSVPAPGPATARYGGNTPCVELRAADGRRLMFDAGTGLRLFGDALARELAAEAAEAAEAPGADGEAPVPLAVLVTHAHADHVQGLPFFAPLAAGRVALTLHAGPTCAPDVRTAVRTLLGPPLFPEANGLAERVAVSVLSTEAEADVAGFAVRAVAVAHPGGACGFVVRDPAGSARVAYISDNELAAVEGECGGRRALLEALADVDVLIHDTTYLPAELPERRGWGHSSYAEAVRLAADAGARRLVLFHHAPDRDDAAVDRLTAVARALAAAARGGGPAVTAAAEGETLAVAGPR